jgi:hypothetical protein
MPHKGPKARRNYMRAYKQEYNSRPPRGCVPQPPPRPPRPRRSVAVLRRDPQGQAWCCRHATPRVLTTRPGRPRRAVGRASCQLARSPLPVIAPTWKPWPSCQGFAFSCGIGVTPGSEPGRSGRSRYRHDPAHFPAVPHAVTHAVRPQAGPHDRGAIELATDARIPGPQQRGDPMRAEGPPSCG